MKNLEKYNPEKHEPLKEYEDEISFLINKGEKLEVDEDGNVYIDEIWISDCIIKNINKPLLQN